MKNLRLFLILFLFCFLSSVSHARNPLFLQMMADGSHCTSTACSTCDQQERAECGSTDGNEELTWSVVGSGTVDFDYTTTVLSGDESISIIDSAGTNTYCTTDISTGGANGSPGTIAFKYQMPSETNAAAIDGFAVQNAAPTVVARCYFVWDTDHWVPRLYYKDSAGTIQSTDSSDSVNGGETWYCMIKYEQASGVDQDDGLTELYNVQDSGGFPGWGVADVSENTCDNDGDAMEYAKVDNKIDAGCRLVFDDMRYDADGTVSY